MPLAQAIAFNAGFIHSFVQDKTIGECAELAPLCGAINTTSSGGTAAFADIDTVKRIALQNLIIIYMTMKENSQSVLNKVQVCLL